MSIHTNHNSGPTGGQYTWDQVRVRIPDGYNQDGTSKWKYRAFIFSPLYYDDYNSNNPTANAYITLDDRGAFNCTRGDIAGAMWQKVSYLFAREDGTFHLANGNTGPDDPATPNTSIDVTQSGIMSGNDPGMPFSMWSPGMPMEGIFPEVGDIVKITDLQLDYRDAVWFNSALPWNHVLPDGSLQNPNWPAAPPQRDWVCLQVLAVITETQFNSNDIFYPSQTAPAINGPGFSPNWDHLCVQKDAPYTPGGGAIVEGCHYHDRALTTSGILPHNVTHGGIGHITFYMKPNPNWVGILNMGVVDQEIGNIGSAECYDVCAYMVAEDHTFPEIPSTGWNTHTYRQWNPRLNDEGPPNLPGTDDCCNIHCPVRRFTQLHQQPSWTRGYKVPYDGRYIIHYEAEVYQSHGNAWSDPSHWNAWVTIDRQIVSWGNQPVGIKYTNPNVWYDGPCYQGGTSYLPNLPPFNATWTSAGPGNYCAHWYADDSNGVYKYGDLEYEIDLKKGMEIQIVLKGRNSAFAHTNYGRIRKQYFHVRPKPGIILVNSVVIQNDAPPPDSLCYGVPTEQEWLGHVQYGGTAHQHNGGIDAEPGHDWKCCYYCDPLSGWEGATTIMSTCAECLKMPSWNCDLSISYLPVTIDPVEWWKISGQGCVDPGDGSGMYKSFSGYTGGQWDSCISQCNLPWWECDGNGSCVEHTTVAPIGAYMTLTICQANCATPSWDCDNLVAGGSGGGAAICYDPGTGNGQFTSLSLCQADCDSSSYDCVDGVCYQAYFNIGMYSTLATCKLNCFKNSWNCINNSCIDPNDGTGIFPLLSTCKDICSEFKPCSTYFAVCDDGTAFGTTTIWEKKLYYYDAVNNSTTYILDLPLDTIPLYPTEIQKQDNGIANTDTKLWAWGYNPTATTESTIVEYDIITPTSLTYNRTIQDIQIAGLNIGSLSAINNKTLVALSADPGTYCTTCNVSDRLYMSYAIACQGILSPFYSTHPWITTYPLTGCHAGGTVGYGWWSYGMTSPNENLVQDLVVNYGPHQDVRKIYFQSNIPCDANTHPDCCGPDNVKLKKIDYFKSPYLNGGQEYYTWGDFVDAMYAAGVPCYGCCGTYPCPGMINPPYPTQTQHILGYRIGIWGLGIDFGIALCGGFNQCPDWLQIKVTACECDSGCVSVPPGNQSMVIEVDVHPVTGPTILEKFLVDKDDVGDSLFWPQQKVLFVTSNDPPFPGNGTISKYDYSTGTLLNSALFIPSGGDVGTIRGLAMSEGNLYAYQDVLTNRKYLINKQTLAQLYLSINIGTITQHHLYNSTVLPVDFDAPNVSWPHQMVHQGGIEDASSSPCCDDNLSNCGGCAKTLTPYLTYNTGYVKPIKFVPYDPWGDYYIGDCVSDPGGCCKCCTYGQLPTPVPNWITSPPNNSSARLYTTTLSYVEGETSKTKEKATHLEEIKRWFADPINKHQDKVWNTSYFAKRNHEDEKEVCGDDFEAISLFSLTISVNGKSHTFDDTSTWSDVIKHSISLGARVDKSMTWDKYIKLMYSSFGDNAFSHSASENSCGCYSDETSGPSAKVKNIPCEIRNGEYVSFNNWMDCEVDIHGDDCTGGTMNWGCCGGNFLSTTFQHARICDNRQGTCPSGCANIDSGYVGSTAESFFEWYTKVTNGLYAVDIITLKYILNTRIKQLAWPCHEPNLGWWYHFSSKFGIVGSATSSGIVSTHFQTMGTTTFSTWLEFVTVLYSNGFTTINLGVTFTQLLNHSYTVIINKLQLLQPGFDLYFPSTPCACDEVECVQNVPKPDGYLTKEGCQDSGLSDCPYSDQRCTPDPWRCMYVPKAGDFLCVQKEPTAFNQITYATEQLCKQSQNSCKAETYDCKTSYSDCVSKNLLPHIVGRWWDGVQATNTITATPVATSTELFANAIFGQQSTDIRSVRWEHSTIAANTISSWDCIPTSPLALFWGGAPWIIVTGIEFKDPFETNNVNNTMGLPGLPVYTWLDYISLLNAYGVGTVLTPSMSSGQVASIIENYMGWSFVTFGVSWRRCVCDPNTTHCTCIDPGDGSGIYGSLYACQTAPFSCCGVPPI